MAAVMSMSAGAGLAMADFHEEAERGPSFVPVETRACNFQDDKSLGDLMAFTQEFDAWLDDEVYTDYFVAIVTRHYYGEKKMDVGWLGAWANGNAMGVGADKGLTDGGELAAEFAGIVVSAALAAGFPPAAMRS